MAAHVPKMYITRIIFGHTYNLIQLGLNLINEYLLPIIYIN